MKNELINVCWIESKGDRIKKNIYEKRKKKLL